MNFRLFKTTLRCKKPFHIATGVMNVCHGIVLELRTEDGLVGWGEASPDPYLTGESVAGCVTAIREHLLPAVKGLDPFSLEEAHRRMSHAHYGHPAARCAVDLAFHDLIGKRSGQPVVRVLGGVGKPVLTNYSIGLGKASADSSEARSLVEQGFHIIKLKVGGDPAEDLERVGAVRAAIGPDIKLRIDANEGWKAHQAAWALSRMERYDVELCEQPLARLDLAGSARLRQRTSIPIVADESVRSPYDALACIEAEAFDGFNIKLMKSGGLWPARQIVTLARMHGLSLMVGGMVGESGLAVNAAASLASAYDFEFADLDADLLLQDELLSPPSLTLERSHRHITMAPGWGVAGLDHRFLEEI